MLFFVCLIFNRFRDRKTIRQRRINSLKKKISLKEKLLEVRSSKGSCKKFPFTANYRFICRYLCFETIQVWKIAFLLIGKSKEALNVELLICNRTLFIQWKSLLRVYLVIWIKLWIKYYLFFLLFSCHHEGIINKNVSTIIFYIFKLDLI